MAAALAAAFAFPQAASAISVSGTLSAAALEAALIAPASGLTVTGFVVSGHTDGAGAESAGTFTNAANTYGIGPGIVLSTGNVNDYNTGPNLNFDTTTGYFVAATAGQQALLGPISGQATHNDVTQIDITFDLAPGTDSVFFNVVFGSEEYAEYLGSSFIDAFGMFVNGNNIAFTNGQPINIDHSDMGFVSGTELDGVLGGSTGAFGPLVHTFGAFIGDGALNNTLTFIIADSGDSSLDSTVFISQVGGTPPPPPSATPEPVTASLGLLGLLAVGLGTSRRRR